MSSLDLCCNTLLAPCSCPMDNFVIGTAHVQAASAPMHPSARAALAPTVTPLYAPRANARRERTALLVSVARCRSIRTLCPATATSASLIRVRCKPCIEGLPLNVRNLTAVHLANSAPPSHEHVTVMLGIGQTCAISAMRVIWAAMGT
jgi:hypothetical protein